jgi:hypothetical protein
VISLVTMEGWEDWQKAYRFGTLVIWPPDEVRELVNRHRERYDPVSQAICETHITLTEPLRRPLADEEWGLVAQVDGSSDAFQINYGPLSAFLPYPCIW